MTEPRFSERQRFRQWWLWLLVLIVPASALWTTFQLIVIESSIRTSSMGDLVTVTLGLVFGVGVPWLMYSAGLDTEVDEYGARIRFRPFHRRWVVFGFATIQKAEAITYSPLREYGGWGIRYGRRGKAYNVSGSRGVLLTLKDGSNVLIGSAKHEALCSRIREELAPG